MRKPERKGNKTVKRTIMAVLLLASLFLSGCFLNSDPREKVSGELGLDLREAQILENEERRGIHGDGDLILTLQIAEEKRPAAEEKILNARGWRPLPMSEMMCEALYSDWPTFTRSSDGTLLVPDVMHGSYYLRNRMEGVADPYDENTLWGPSSYRFTLAIYDSESGKLYYCSIDR